MAGIKMSDCRFYVNKDERTVVCVIHDTRDMLYDFVFDKCMHKGINLPNALWDWKGFNMPNSFMGKSVCAPEDEWDEETGRLIAFSRAKAKCYKSFFKRANNLIQEIDLRLNEVIELFNDFGTKLDYNKHKLEERINEALDK